VALVMDGDSLVGMLTAENLTTIHPAAASPARRGTNHRES
jgi:hypothetical protein